MLSEEFQHVSGLMAEPLPDEPEALILALENIEVWNARMQFLLAEENSILDIKSFEIMPPKDKKSEFERKLQLEASISFLRQRRDKVEGLCEAIKTRITLGQSILKYYSTTQNIQYKDNTKSLKQILGD